MNTRDFQTFVDIHGQDSTALQLGQAIESIVNTPPNYRPTETECKQALGAIIIFAVAHTGENKYSIAKLPAWATDARLSRELQALISLGIGKIEDNTQFITGLESDLAYFDQSFR